MKRLVAAIVLAMATVVGFGQAVVVQAYQTSGFGDVTLTYGPDGKLIPQYLLAFNGWLAFGVAAGGLLVALVSMSVAHVLWPRSPRVDRVRANAQVSASSQPA